LPNEPGVTAAVFDGIAEHGFLVDDIMQTVAAGGQKVTLGFTVAGLDRGELRAVAELLGQRFLVEHVDITSDLMRVSVIGVGMRSHSGVAARMFAALAAAKIRIENIATSEIVISVLVPAAEGERALQAVHATFELEHS